MTFVAKELHSLSVKAKGNSILEVLKIKFKKSEGLLIIIP